MTPQEYVHTLKPDLQPTAKALIDQLMAVEPNFETRKAWAGYGFKQGDNYSCIIAEYKDHLKLMIMRGIMLEDTKQFLEGSGVNTRHIKYYTVDDVTTKDATPFLKQQFKLYADGLRWE